MTIEEISREFNGTMGFIPTMSDQRGCACDGVGMCTDHIEEMLRQHPFGLDPTTEDRPMMENGEFYHTDGWYFKRLDDGAVRIRIEPDGLTHIIPPHEWASIVGHVAHTPVGVEADNGTKTQQALALHVG